MTQLTERQFISEFWFPIGIVDLRLRLVFALALIATSGLLLIGCSRSDNGSIDLGRRVDTEELGCFFSPSSIVQREGLAYATSGGNLTILDVSDPVYPRCVSTYDTTRGASDIALDGQYAYLATQGLLVMDISDPRNPQELFRYDVDSAATDIKLKDGYAYLAAESSGLLIFDVSNPQRPELVSQMTFPEAAVDSPRVNVTAIDFVGEYVYVLVQGDYPYFIAILDVSDPAAPKVLRRFVPESELNPWDIVVHGQHAFLNGGFRYLDVVDVSDPLAPRLMGSADIPGGLRQYVVDGNYVYVGGGENISVIDVADPAQPRVAGFYEIGTNNISRVGDYIYSVGQTLENGDSYPLKLHIFRFVP
ncbi:MAG: hypothetical protein KDI03_09045 [Anaerolineae bacterium]|nr:hypothetical protein [Anaerolineae bacterium]MCB0255159.1 hypothetical protein [Anaerolineae bacterium]